MVSGRFIIMGFIACAMMTVSCKDKRVVSNPPVKENVAVSQMAAKYNISSEDREGIVTTFLTYLENNRRNTNSQDCDSLMNRCIKLVWQQRYDILHELLDSERLNIYDYPCNSIKNELSLFIVVDLLCTERYSALESELYVRLKPWCEHLKERMEADEKETKKRHSQYLDVMRTSMEIYEMLGGPDEFLDTALKVVSLEDAQNDPAGYYDSLLALSRAYKVNGMDASADSCLAIARYMRY